MIHIYTSSSRSSAENVVFITESTKLMHGELEIVVFSDYSHLFLPSKKTIVHYLGYYSTVSNIGMLAWAENIMETYV